MSLSPAVEEFFQKLAALAPAVGWRFEGKHIVCGADGGDDPDDPGLCPLWYVGGAGMDTHESGRLLGLSERETWMIAASADGHSWALADPDAEIRARLLAAVGLEESK